MKKINRILKELSKLYEFNRRIKSYKLKKKEASDKRLETDTTPRRTPQS